GQSRQAFRLANELLAGVSNAHALDRRGDWVDGDEWATELEDAFLPNTQHPERAASVEARAAMLHAILMVRVDGQVSRRGRLARRVHVSVRTANLRAAHEALVAQQRTSPDDPRLSAYVAEAAVAVDASAAADSLATLRDLAQRDLIGDPLTWLALAALEEDAEARDAHLERCRNMVSRRANQVCAVSSRQS
ncbi:MAG: hypothetical protein AAF645_28270, partial [Myxococcota bacterium]